MNSSSAALAPAWTPVEQGVCLRATMLEVSYELALAAAGRPDAPTLVAPDPRSWSPSVTKQVTANVTVVLSTATAELLASEDRAVARVMSRHRAQVAALCASA